MVFPYALRNVVRAARRNASVFATVAVGVWSLLFLGAFNQGAVLRLREVTVHSRHAHGEVTRAGYFQKTYDKPSDHWIESGAEAEARLRAIPGVAATFPRVSFPALATNGRVSIGAIGQGVDGARESTFFNELNIERGTMLTNELDGVILGRGLARSLDVKPGDVITILGTTVDGTTNSIELTVIGIFHTGTPAFDDRTFRLPITAAKAFLNTDRVESVALALTVDRDDAWPAVERAVEREMPALEATSYATLEEIDYGHSRDWLASQAGVFRIIIAVLVFFGVLNSAATSVLERRQEVGNLRANGESRLDVLFLFSLEALFVALAAALAGIALHLITTHIFLAKGVMLPPPGGHTRPLLVMLATDTQMVVTIAVAAVIVTLVGATFASLRAVRMTVAEALRST